MNKTIIGLIGLMLCLMILPMVNAQEVYKQNVATDIKASCVNGIPVAGCTCKLTIANPNGSFLINDGTMTDLGTGFYNYTVTFANLGTYQMTQSCTDGTNNGTDSGEIFITSTGNDSNLYLPLILGIFGLTLMVVAMWKKNGWLGLFSGFVFIILGIYSMIYGLGVIQDQYTEMISYVILGWGLILCFVAIAEELYGDGGESSD